MTAPSLRTLEPVAVAREVVGLVLHHLARYAVPLSPGRIVVPEPRDGAERCDLGMTVQDLVAWAQTGDGDAEEAWDAAQTACSALYSRAGEPGTYGAGPLDSGQGEPRDAIGVVLLATWARYQLVRGEDLTTRALAALAGVSKTYINRLVQRGDVPTRSRTGARGASTITALQAARLLAARVVGAEDAAALARAGARWTYGHGAGRTWLRIESELAAVAMLATERGWAPGRRTGTWLAYVAGAESGDVVART